MISFWVSTYLAPTMLVSGHQESANDRQPTREGQAVAASHQRVGNCPRDQHAQEQRDERQRGIEACLDEGKVPVAHQVGWEPAVIECSHRPPDEMTEIDALQLAPAQYDPEVAPYRVAASAVLPHAAAGEIGDAAVFLDQLDFGRIDTGHFGGFAVAAEEYSCPGEAQRASE